MNFTRFDMKAVAAVALASSLAVSIALYFYISPNRVERVLFFPGSIERDLAGEPRLVPRSDGLESAVRTVVRELVYGPARIDRSRVVSRNTRATSVIVRGSTAYIDLSTDILDVEEEALPLSLEESLKAIEHTIHFNFRSIERVIITIGGEMLRGPTANRASPSNT